MGVTQRNAGLQYDASHNSRNPRYTGSFYGNTQSSYQLTPELTRVLRYLTTLIFHYDQSFEAKRLGFALMGISRLSSDLPEVCELVGNITVKANDAWGDLNGQELSMCVHGKAYFDSRLHCNLHARTAISVLIMKPCCSHTSCRPHVDALGRADGAVFAEGARAAGGQVPLHFQVGRAFSTVWSARHALQFC